MKISELIEQLEYQKHVHGDILVQVYKPSGKKLQALVAPIVHYDLYFEDKACKKKYCIVIAP